MMAGDISLLLKSDTSQTNSDPGPSGISVVATLTETIRDQAAEIERLRKEVRELTEAATRDPLTGLLNRRGFEQEMTRALALAARHDSAGTLLMIDLDGFKPVNDTYGHAAGDQVLLTIARILEDNLRESDAVARMGGDEFAVILQDTDRQDGMARAEAISEAINGSQAIWDGQAISLAASVGFQRFGGTDRQETILAAADAAMYSIKNLRESVAHRTHS